VQGGSCKVKERAIMGVTSLTFPRCGDQYNLAAWLPLYRLLQCDACTACQHSGGNTRPRQALQETQQPVLYETLNTAGLLTLGAVVMMVGRWPDSEPKQYFPGFRGTVGESRRKTLLTSS
jgi:hypothetical protein